MSYLFGRYLSTLFFRFKDLFSTRKNTILIGFVSLAVLLSSQAYALTTVFYSVELSTPTEDTTNADTVVFQINFLYGAQVFGLTVSDVAFLLNEGNATIQSISPSLNSNRYLVTLQTGSSGATSIRLNSTSSNNGVNYSLKPTVLFEIYTIDKIPPNPPSLSVLPVRSLDPTPVISGTADPDSTVTISSVGGQGCSIAVPANGNWSCEVTPALPFGTNILNVQAEDIAGNTSQIIPISLNILNPNDDPDQDTLTNDIELPLGDTDRDGILNYNDADDDNDGILTINELPGDTDNDGIPDYLESNIIDTDGDGHFDFDDADDDDDGKPTSTEIIASPLAFIDADTDGIPDHLDKDETNTANTADLSGDSDGDGISDLIECPNIAGTPCPDSDGDGIPDYMDTEITAFYTVKRSTPTEATTNEDTVIFQIDFLSGAQVSDLEITDINFILNESGATLQSITSSDSNRYLVSVQTLNSGGISIRLNPTSKDNNDVDYELELSETGETYTIDKTSPSSPFISVLPVLSLDPTPIISGTADSDSIVTIRSVGGQGCSVAVPANGNWSCEVNPALPFGINDLNAQAEDIAGNTSPVMPISLNILNPNDDPDQDTLINEIELPLGDTDRDGDLNYNDADDDNDGILTINELPGDTDNDGIPDYLESNIIDTDGDGHFDFDDADDDNDGKPTSTEIIASPLAFSDADTDGIPDHLDKDETNTANTADSSGDSDNNGISDLIECPNIVGRPCPDLDHDGIPDYMDTDNDNDGLSDVSEIGNNPLNPTDTDFDTVPDYNEPNHRDTDGDELRNHQDADDDGDNLPTSSENPTYNDIDSDGIPDYLDPDTNSSSPNGNRDGDADNDTILDRVECPTGPICLDSDGDAIPDYMDDDSLAGVPAVTPGVDTGLKGGGSFNVFLLTFLGLILFLRKFKLGYISSVSSIASTNKPALFSAFFAFPLITLILLSQLSQPIYAANGLEKQWYVGGAIGKSTLKPNGHGVWNVTDDSDIGKKIYAGIDINKSIGVEAFWNDFGKATISNGSATDEVEYSAYGANVIYHAPLYLDKLHPFGKLGVAKLSTKTKGDTPINQLNDYSLFAGLGAEYSLTKSLTLRGEYEHFDKDVKQLSMGLNWAPNGRAQYDETAGQVAATAIPAALPNVVIHRPTPQPTYQAPRPVITKPIMPRATQYKTLNRTLSGGSNFATGSAQLTSAGASNLTNLARDIKQSRLQLHSIQIVGHTDNVGNDHSNQQLSEQRANTVANFLSNQGINRQVMRTIGRGERQPTQSNATAHGKASNRRVEISIQGTETVTVMN